MRCCACNEILSDYESTRKSLVTGEYLDLCNHCLNLGYENEILFDLTDGDEEGEPVLG